MDARARFRAASDIVLRDGACRPGWTSRASIGSSTPVDLEQRKHWDAYRRAYEDAIRATNTDEAPWYIVPADSKTHRNLIVATLLQDVFRSMDLSYPQTDPKIGKIKVAAAGEQESGG